MLVVWLVYILALVIFFFFGWTGVYHARKYGIPGDFTKKAAVIYAALILFIVFLTASLALKNGADAPIKFPKINVKELPLIRK